MGCIPTKNDTADDELRGLWCAAELRSPSEDGWHFVPCSKCGGTGRVSWLRSILRIPRWFWAGLKFIRHYPGRAPGMSRLSHFWLLVKCAWLYDLARLFR